MNITKALDERGHDDLKALEDEETRTVRKLVLLSEEIMELRLMMKVREALSKASIPPVPALVRAEKESA